LQLWSWTEDEFEKRHEGSAIRRIGYQRWRRNLAVAMGNALADEAVSEVDKDELREVLRNALPTSDAMVVEHIEWALDS
jgi:epoxyqueuosine reductase